MDRGQESGSWDDEVSVPGRDTQPPWPYGQLLWSQRDHFYGALEHSESDHVSQLSNTEINSAGFDLSGRRVHIYRIYRHILLLGVD